MNTRWSERGPSFQILLWIFVPVLAVFALVPVLHGLRGDSIKDYFVWYEAGRQFLAGGEVYPDPQPGNKFPFMYPPSCALLLAPVSALGQLGLIVALALVNAAAWLCSIVFSVRLACSERTNVHPLVYLLPNLIVAAFIWGNFLLGQPSLVLLALLLGAFLLLQGKRQGVAGVLIALAAAIKAFPFLAIIYLVYRRYWLATATLILTLVFLLIIAPLPFRGYALAKQDLQRWSSGMLFKYDETGVAQRVGRGNSWKNQSIFGVANRLLRHVESNHRNAPHTPVYANFVDLKFATVNAIIVTAALLLGLTFVFVMPSGAQRTKETDAIEFALLLLLILIFTPLTFGYLFAWLLYPFTVIVQRLLVAPRPALLLPTCGAVVLLGLAIPWRIPAQTYGNILLTTAVLFCALSAELWRVKNYSTGTAPGTGTGRGSP